ncbi:MarR family winged helix-turn-helix transcriptional regulator [Allostreptomyces psammosilenae]|uniref:DNA-binding MarR family transcriptional regulator n=1 Tax=Allostreptomyces psammosilenae TaxID=1892865 RepID=A0A852ZZC5_9ACTN|nr:MarR family transcriptional regulator [Allostreptomyces psammosilenae]NYI06044.1 DNA-binding MarR family transcriptional regulator [Allostreptomyces psammosilenae]
MTSTEDALYDHLQHQVALFARRAEQTRMGGVGRQRNSMDRAAYLLLNRLELEGPVGVKALAESMGIDSSTVTRQVAPLVEGGLVDRVPNPEDGRAVLLDLSQEGRRRLSEVRESRRELMRLLVSDWPRDDQAEFDRLLTRFNEALSSYHRPTGMPES